MSHAVDPDDDNYVFAGDAFTGKDPILFVFIIVLSVLIALRYGLNL